MPLGVTNPESSTCLLLLLHLFNGLFSMTTWVSQYQKNKTILGLNEAIDGVLGCSGISWTICKQSAPRSRQLTTPTSHHFRPDALPDAQPTVSKHRLSISCGFTSQSTQNSSLLAWYEKTKLNTTKACIYQSNEMYYNTHTHTHLFNSHFFRNTRVSRYQKGTTNLDFTQARDSERQWHQRVHVSRAPSVERRLWSAS